MRTNIRPIHWVAAPPLTGLVVLAGSYPVTEDSFGSNCGSFLASEVSCDSTESIIFAFIGAIVVLGILLWSYRWQTRRLQEDSS